MVSPSFFHSFFVKYSCFFNFYLSCLRLRIPTDLRIDIIHGEKDWMFQYWCKFLEAERLGIIFSHLLKYELCFGAPPRAKTQIIPPMHRFPFVCLGPKYCTRYICSGGHQLTLENPTGCAARFGYLVVNYDEKPSKLHQKHVIFQVTALFG